MKRAVPLLFAFALSTPALGVESVCYGSVRAGRIEDSVALPVKGENFRSYSRLAATLGRTHVHSKVEQIVTAAYEALAREAPQLTFVYGETGWPDGGDFYPHRTHQNGLSVDFFVPVRNAQGRSVPLPTETHMRFGYDIEFDETGKWEREEESYRIDFAAIAEHLHQLHSAAQARGAGIALVILDPRYHAKLFATPRGTALKESMRFMKGTGWVRHDEHYHVDFALPCKPL